jgi:hypothetical protein
MDYIKFAIDKIDREHAISAGMARQQYASIRADQELLKAEHQLTGFAHASQGFDVVSLIESMALRSEEWEELRGETWVTEKMREEIDAHFHIEKE